MFPIVASAPVRRAPVARARALLAVVLLSAAPAARAHAQAADTLGAVAGVVRGPGGTVVVGAEIVLTPLRDSSAGPGTVFARRLFSDEEGRFRVTGMPAGRAMLAVRRIGYRPATRELGVPSAEQVAVALEAVPQGLTAVVVKDRRVKYTGWAARFYERRDRGFGRYITKEDMDRRNAMRTTDVLRSIPGMQVVSTPRGNLLRLRANRCDPFIWLDGTPATAGYLDVDAFAPNTLEGIEVYSGVGTVPVELRGPRGEEACGVIALWTRMPEPRRKKNAKVYTADDLAALVASATVYTADQVDQAAMPDSSAPLAPYYPNSLKQAKTTGEAIVEFVVDTAGTPEIETIGIVAATHPAFGTAARDAVAAARYQPAIKGGRPVRQLVQVPVKFEATGS
jgi:TonB family protein